METENKDWLALNHVRRQPRPLGDSLDFFVLFVASPTTGGSRQKNIEYAISKQHKNGVSPQKNIHQNLLLSIFFRSLTVGTGSESSGYPHRQAAVFFYLEIASGTFDKPFSGQRSTQVHFAVKNIQYSFLNLKYSYN